MLKNTLIIKNTKKNLDYAAKLLTQNQILAIPTETVYGLAGRADSDSVIKKIYKVKNRPSTNPLIIHFKHIEDALAAINPDNRANLIASKFWPGPLTIVAKNKQNNISKLATSNLTTIAIRVPSDPTAKALLNLLEFPLAAPSANIYGKISPTSANDVKEELDGKISTIIDGGTSEIGLESTVIDLTGSTAKILRYGSISKTKLYNILGKIKHNTNINTIKSPGQVLSHYKPNKKVIINANKPIMNEAWLAFGNIPKNFNGPALSLSKKKCLKEAAKNLYNMMRRLDKKKSNIIVIQKIPKKGIGVAINDRLKRASSK